MSFKKGDSLAKSVSSSESISTDIRNSAIISFLDQILWFRLVFCLYLPYVLFIFFLWSFALLRNLVRLLLGNYQGGQQFGLLEMEIHLPVYSFWGGISNPCQLLFQTFIVVKSLCN